MPLRYIRRKVTTEHVVTIAIGTAATASNMAALASFPPVALPAAILLKIFEIIRDVQTNQQQCYDLAQRCLSFLDLVRDQIADHKSEAPSSLVDALHKFTNTLQSIHSFLSIQVQKKWAARLIRKGTIQAALEDLNSQLDDAFSAFQMATLINIHYTLGDGPLHSPATGMQAAIASKRLVERAPPPSRHQSLDEMTLVGEAGYGASPGDNSAAQDAEDESEMLNDYGFVRYSHSDVSIRGEPRINGGWWAGSRSANVDGQRLLVKEYNDSRMTSRKGWIRDVKILRNIFHPNLPQMVGFSAEECPTPFVVLANVQTRLPQALVLDKIRHGTVAECVRLIARFYLDHIDAALYLQRQLSLSDSKIQDYVENASYRIDGLKTLVMGLPPPEVDNVTSWRNFDLAHSIRQVYLDLLPNRGMNAEKPYNIKSESDTSIETQHKINHLTQILNALLPSSHSSGRSQRLQELLSAYEEDAGHNSATLSLRDIRLASLELGACPNAWREPLVPAYKYRVGDLGYLEERGDFSSFHLIRNVIQDGWTSVPLVREQHGSQAQWYTTSQTMLDPFPCPGNRQGWAVAAVPNESYTVFIVHEERAEEIKYAWQFLMKYGQHYAKAHDVQPEDLILVTRVGIDLRFCLRGPFKPNMPHHPSFPQRPTPPTVLYISTSFDKDQPPSWSQIPLFDQKATPSHNLAGCMISHDDALGFLNYVQLHSEDFDDTSEECPEAPPTKTMRNEGKSTKAFTKPVRAGAWNKSTAARRRHTIIKRHSSKERKKQPVVS